MMESDGLRWLIGLLGSTLIAAAAYRKRALTGSGTVAAITLGTLLYAGGGGSPVWFGTLIAFFLSSTLLGRWKKRARSQVDSVYEKTGNRDAGQVAANGGIALLLCLLNRLSPDAVWLAAYIGAVAAVNADTWATEIGGLSRKPPRSALTWRRVAAGTSGAVSPAGTAASAAGSLFIGCAAYGFALAGSGLPPGVSGPAHSLPVCLAVAFAGGMAGSLADSLLGATLQRMNKCSVCGREVEQPQHCGRPAARLRGLAFMNNDAVNAAASLFGAAAAAGIFRMMR